jgi:hypothetical protein
MQLVSQAFRLELQALFEFKVDLLYYDKQRQTEYRY